MAIAHPRGLRALPARKVGGFGFAALFLLLPFVAQAQGPVSNRLLYDDRWFNLGFLAGVNLGKVKLVEGNLSNPTKQNFQEGVPSEINVETVPGITLGMITNLNINNNIDFRFIPAISLQQRDFNFVFTSSQRGVDSVATRTVEAAFLDLPFMMKFKSDFYRNYRVYVLGGFKVSYNLVSDKRAEDDPDLLKIDNQNFSLEFGAGIDIYADRVKLSPEIRYSLGLLNIYEPKFTNFSDAIRSISTQTITLLFNFE